MFDRINTLVFSPHVDDEVLGCFSFLNRSTIVLFAGVESREHIPAQLRMDELNSSRDVLGFSYEMLDNPVNRYASEKLIAPFEEIINRVKPAAVLLPVRSYNQDHRAVHDAALVATRPHDINWRVNRVLAFEQPHSQIWPYETLSKPGYYRPISIEDKLEAYARYASQVRGHRSPEIVSAMAAMRGAEIGEPFAEGFHVMRWVEP